MAEREPNSVLFSLKELRRIEEQRVEDEAAAEQARLEAARQAKEDEERRAREEIERKRREEEDKVRAEEERREQAEREGRLRVAETERRARIEAEARLQQERMALEVEAHAKAGTHRLRNTVIGVVVIAAILIAGLGYFGYKKSREKEIADQALAAKVEENRRIKAEFDRKQRELEQEKQQIQQRVAGLEGDLASAQTKERRAQLRAQLARERNKELALEARRKQTEIKRRKALMRTVGRSNCPPGDPICGARPSR